MVSDPKTNPDSRTGRIIFGFTVALLAFHIRFGMFIPNAPIWALVVCFPFVPLLDKIFPGPKFQWNSKSEKNGEKNEKTIPVHIGNPVPVNTGRL